VLADVLVAKQRLQDLHERHRRRDFAVVGALQEPLEGSQRRRDQRVGLASPRGQESA
jgi:hypothetical protein